VADQSGASNIEQISQQVLGLFKAPFVISHNMFFASPSMGIASYPDDGTTFEAFFKHADLSLIL
jgi:GGDEF domain-containing protein